MVFGILEHVLWPVRASDRRQQRFADVLRSLAALARLMAQDRPGTPWDREIDDLRRRIAQELGDTQRLLEESKFELKAGELEAFQRRVGDAQIIFLVLLSLAYQRRAAGRLLESLPGAAPQLEAAVARSLEELAGSTRGRGKSPSVDLDAALAAVEAALAPADDTVAAVEQRRQLYRTLVRLVSQLDPRQVDRSRLPAAPPRGAVRGGLEGDRQ